jgi:hypothetical protein
MSAVTSSAPRAATRRAAAESGCRVRPRTRQPSARRCSTTAPPWRPVAPRHRHNSAGVHPCLPRIVAPRAPPLQCPRHSARPRGNSDRTAPTGCLQSNRSDTVTLAQAPSRTATLTRLGRAAYRRLRTGSRRGLAALTVDRLLTQPLWLIPGSESAASTFRPESEAPQPPPGIRPSDFGVVVDEDGKVVGYTGNAVLDARINARDRTEVRGRCRKWIRTGERSGGSWPARGSRASRAPPTVPGRRSVLREARSPPNSRVIPPESG